MGSIPPQHDRSDPAGHQGARGEDDDRLAIAHGQIFRIIDTGMVVGIGFVRNDLFPSFTAIITIAVLIFPDFQLLNGNGPQLRDLDVRAVLTDLAGWPWGCYVRMWHEAADRECPLFDGFRG
jgi:hypothetical protein